MTNYELFKRVLEVLPNATFGEDMDGQIIIYTDMMIKPGDEDETLIPFDVKE